MSRTNDPATIAELQAQVNHPVWLVEVHLDSEPVYLTSFDRHLEYDGKTFAAESYLLGMGAFQESSNLIVATTTLSLSGVEQEFLASVLQEEYKGRSVIVHKGFLDDAEQVAGVLDHFWDGEITSWGLDENPEDGKSVIAVEVANAWSQDQHASGRQASDADQQLWFSGDMGMQQPPNVGQEFPWGRK